MAPGLSSVDHVLALLLVAVSLGLSNFAAAIGIGVAGTTPGTRLRVGLVFGLFEVGMPLLGLLLGQSLAGFALGTYHVRLVVAAVVIGAVSTGMTLAGLELGDRLGPRIGARGELLGGLWCSSRSASPSPSAFCASAVFTGTPCTPARPRIRRPLTLVSRGSVIPAGSMCRFASRKP